MTFFDTNILLYGDKNFLNSIDKFFISSVTIEELEHIKTSIHKDENIKYKAREVVRWLVENEDKYEVIIYNESKIVPCIPCTVIDDINNNDKKIVLTALYVEKILHEELIFYTYDLNCYLLAKECGLTAFYYVTEKEQKYAGYSKIFCRNEEELADLYTKIYSNSFGGDDFNINEYILIHDQDNNLIDKYKYKGNNTFEKINFLACNSKMFGKVKPIDEYQELVLDSFKHNKLTLVKGRAGTGKSLLSLAYLFMLLEQGQIDRIIIFCNTVATAGSAKLGYYPGDRTEKLLDSQIGNFLISKIGAREGVERLIAEGQLLLLPMSDIRGFDTSGMKAGIYITEAQNLHIDLMKLALQRIGEDSICILDGDNDTQVDLNLYAGSNNGLRRVSEIFRNHDFYGEVTLQKVHRSKIAELAGEM